MKLKPKPIDPPQSLLQATNTDALSEALKRKREKMKNDLEAKGGVNAG